MEIGKNENAKSGEIIMQIKNLTKTFGPVVALDSVNIDIKRGEIIGLIGENGSGKSTVSSIFAGMQKQTSGEMFYNSEKWNPESMEQALENGVGMIVQEGGTVPGITVAENLFICDTLRFSMFGKGKVGYISSKKMYAEANEALKEIGAYHIKATDMTSALDMMDRKLVEVARVWMKKPQIMVVDETTTALSQKGREIIYDLMERMKKDNKAVVFISHDLEEITSRCDRLTVLRDGHIIRTFEKDEFDDDKIRMSMIGREMTGDYYRYDYEKEKKGKVVLKAKNISYSNKLKDVSLEAHSGEILGIGGLSDSGMHALGKILFGAIKADKGEVTVYAKPLKDTITALKNSVGYTAKDRDTESLCLSASIKDNIAITGFEEFSKSKFFILPKEERKFVNQQIDFMKIKCFSMDQPVWQLSGGNKQKVVFGKWIGCKSEILILDCPTRGIDIGVKQTMYRLMYSMKKEGKTIILISEEMTELMGMSDRIIIMKNGEITKEFERSKDLTDAEIIKYMI